MTEMVWHCDFVCAFSYFCVFSQGGGFHGHVQHDEWNDGEHGEFQSGLTALLKLRFIVEEHSIF